MTIVFLDLETTGLNLDDDLILEIGAVAVDPGLDIISDFHTLVWHDMPKVAKAMDDYVFDMHSTSGLLDELALAARRLLEQGVFPRDVFGPTHVNDLLCEWLDSLPMGPDDELILAGSGVSEFDRPLLRRDFPRAEAKFHYRTWELGALRRLLPVINLPDIADEMHTAAEKNPAPHRALTDAANSLNQLRAARELGIEIHRRWTDTL